MVTPDTVKRLWAILEKRHPGMLIVCNIYCDDGLKFVVSDPDSVVEHSNLGGKEIRELEMKVLPEDEGIRFSSSDYLPPILIVASGQDRRVLALRDALLEVVAATKPWFNLLARVSIFYILVGLGWLLVVFAQTLPKSSKPTTPAVMLASLALLAGVDGIFGFGVSWLHRKFFPIATFAIGHGAQRHEVAEKVRWVLVGLFTSVFVVAPLVRLMWSWWK
ncbi:MAG: hypothetical protein HOW73_32260 [Polyangiaceae bacterium]|nr:hypothetical protein [Polyangiaceae bacterium]